MQHEYTEHDVYFDYYEGLFKRCKERNRDDPQRSANMFLLETINEQYYNAGWDDGYMAGQQAERKRTQDEMKRLIKEKLEKSAE